MKHLKKITAAVFAVLVLVGVMFGSATTAYAGENHVTNIDIEVVIKNEEEEILKTKFSLTAF